jgi:hypothetical protein
MALTSAVSGSDSLNLLVVQIETGLPFSGSPTFVTHVHCRTMEMFRAIVLNRLERAIDLFDHPTAPGGKSGDQSKREIH